MIEIKTVCCGKEMIDLEEQQHLMDLNTNSVRRLVCGECGSITEIKEFSLDDEEYISEFQDEEKINKTNFFKELIKEGVEAL